MPNKPRVTQKNLFSIPEGKYSLGDNLLLRVRGSSRSFFIRFYKNGKNHEVSLGSANYLTINDARIKIHELKTRLFNGENILVDNQKKEMVLFSDVYEEAIVGIQRAKKIGNKKNAI